MRIKMKIIFLASEKIKQLDANGGVKDFILKRVGSFLESS